MARTALAIDIPATPPAADAAAALAPVQKAAILMLAFGEEAATAILRNLSPSEVQLLGAAMFGVRNIDNAILDAVVEEFLQALTEDSGLGASAPQFVRRVMTAALGEERAASVLGRIGPVNDRKPIGILEWMDARAIAELITDEHPQIIALVIACLDHAHGADVLTMLPDTVQPDIIRRIAAISHVGPEALSDLEAVLQRKFKAGTSLRSSQIGGVKAAARIMNFTRSDMEQRIMKDLRRDDRDLGQAIEDNMFVFDNLVNSDERSLQTLLRTVDAALLVLALKGADDILRDKLLGCMSTRAAANLRDEMDALGPVRLTEVQEAQKQIIAVARRLADEGTIVLAGRGGEQMV